MSPYFHPACHLPKRCGKTLFYDVTPQSTSEKIKKWLGFETKVCSGSKAFTLEWEEAELLSFFHMDMDCDALSIFPELRLLRHRDLYYFALNFVDRSFQPQVLREPTGAFGLVHTHNESHYLLEYKVLEIQAREQFLEVGYPDIESAVANSVAAMRIPNCRYLVTNDPRCSVNCEYSDNHFFRVSNKTVILVTICIIVVGIVRMLRTRQRNRRWF